MTAVGPITALEANALADGELSGEVEAEVRQALGADDQLRTVAAWRDQLDRRLHNAYDGTLTETLPLRTRRLFTAHPAWSIRAFTQWAAAAIAIAAVAACIGYVVGLKMPMDNGGVDQVARHGLGAHRIFASEIQHPVEVPGSDSDHLAKWLGKRLGLEFTAPDISQEGFVLVGGRLLAEGPQPAGLLMYEDSIGQRVTLYMEKWPAEGETALRFMAANELSTYYWTDNRFAARSAATWTHTN